MVYPSPAPRSVRYPNSVCPLPNPRSVCRPTHAWTVSRMTRRSRCLQNMDPDEHLDCPPPPPSNREAVATSPDPMLAAGTVVSFPTPVVLRVLPLRGSLTPVGYIYDATPDGNEGLLAATLAAIRSFTSPVQIWRPIVRPRVWFCLSSMSIAFRIISFLRGWSFWMVSSLLCPLTRGRRL